MALFFWWQCKLNIFMKLEPEANISTLGTFVFHYSICSLTARHVTESFGFPKVTGPFLFK